MSTIHYDAARCEILPAGFPRKPGTLPPLCLNVVGPTILGSMLNALGCGMVIVLGLIFLGRFKEGCSQTAKIITITLINLNVLQTTILIYSVVLTAGTHFGQVGFYMAYHNQPASFATPFLEAVIILICESFLAHRCLHFIRAVAPHRAKMTMVFAIFMAVGIVGAFGTGMATLGIMWSKGNYLQLINTPRNSSLYPTLKTTSLALNCLVDLVLASVMTWECHRAKSSFRASNKVLESLITVMITSGVLVLCVQLWAGILYFVTASSGWSITPVLVLGKIYTMTFLLSILRPKSVEASVTLANLTAAVGKLNSAYPADDTLSSVETLQGMMIVPSFGTPCSTIPSRSSRPSSSGRVLEEGEEHDGRTGRKFSGFGGRSKRWSEVTKVGWFHGAKDVGEEDEKSSSRNNSMVGFGDMFATTLDPTRHQAAPGPAKSLLLDSSRSGSSGSSSTSGASSSCNSNTGLLPSSVPPPLSTAPYKTWLRPSSHSTESSPYPSPTATVFPSNTSSPTSEASARLPNIKQHIELVHLSKS